MILQAVYEPVFLNCSHGFRPNRSCHTALTEVKNEFTGARWFVEGDIKGCFDNIDHTVLVGLINQKIKDARLVNLIRQIYESWLCGGLALPHRQTYQTSTQQAGLSPDTCEYLSARLDRFVMKLKADFDVYEKKMYNA
jgi:hypothetical protein